MTFSVIIPVYNVENYLRECVDSIVNQTCQDFELILIDNGSTDSSGKICDEYASKYPNIRVKHLMPNIMAAGARNEGQSMAEGDYILFIDSDDYYFDSHVFEKIKEKSLGNPDVILFNHIEFFEKSGFMRKCNSMDVPIEGRSVLQICSELIDRNGYFNSAWSKAIKRTLLTNNEIQFTLGIRVEDNDWYNKVILLVKSIAIVDEYLYVYRRRVSGSITTTGTMQNVIDCLDVIEKWTKIVEQEKNNPNAQIVLLSLGKQYCNYLIGYCRLPSDKAVYKRFWDYKYLLKYSNNPRVKSFRRIERIVGLSGLVFLLKVYRKVR